MDNAAKSIVFALNLRSGILCGNNTSGVIHIYKHSWNSAKAIELVDRN